MSQTPLQVQEQNQQGRMSQSETRLVSLRQRGFVGGQKVHGLVEIEEGAGGFPEAEKKCQLLAPGPGGNAFPVWTI